MINYVITTPSGKKMSLVLWKKNYLCFLPKKVRRLPGLREEQVVMGYEIGQRIAL
jgi:hypothetical protein